MNINEEKKNGDCQHSIIEQINGRGGKRKGGIGIEKRKNK